MFSPLAVQYALVFLFVFSVFLLSFIVLRRIYKEYREKRFNEKYKEIEKDILVALSSETPELAARVARKYKAYPKVLTQILVDYIEIIGGAEGQRLKIISDQFLKKRWTKNIRSWKAINRLKAARLFMAFSDTSDSDVLIKLLNDKPIIRLTAINALARIPSQKTLSIIFQAFEKDPNPNIEAYFNIMFTLAQKIEYFIKHCFKKTLSIEKLGLLIELVGQSKLYSLYSDVLGMTNHTAKEIRVKAARALGYLSVPDSMPTLIELTKDQDWEVRAQAIKSLGKLKCSDALDVFADGLFSPHWHIRLNAAYALFNLGLPGITRLKEISKQKKDRYAADMASMVLSDLIYFEEPTG